MPDVRANAGHTTLKIGLVILAGLFAGACKGGRRGAVTPTPVPPALTLEATAFAGSPLNPTTSPASRPSDGQAVRLDVTWLALRRLPPDALPPLDARSTLVTAPLAGGPVLVSGRQTGLAGFGEGVAADTLLTRLRLGPDRPAAQAGHQVGLVAPGTTARFRCTIGRTDRTLVLSVSRPLPSGAELPSTAPATTSPAPTTATTGPAARPVDGAITVALRGFAEGPATTETAFLDNVSLAPGSRFAVVVPCDFGTPEWTALAVYVNVEDAAADGPAVAAGMDRPAATRPDSPTTLPGERLTLQRAIQALQGGGDPRPALLFLAGVTDAAVAIDGVLVADGATLDRVRDETLAFANADAEPPAVESVSWFLDRTVLLTLAAAAEKGTLPPELSAVLVRHAGEVGRHPDALADAANAVGNRADLLSRLIGENYIALEDSAPAARVRAYDWLKAQGRAPAGFDPLASAHDRRAAINRALDAQAGGPR